MPPIRSAPSALAPAGAGPRRPGAPGAPSAGAARSTTGAPAPGADAPAPPRDARPPAGWVSGASSGSSRPSGRAAVDVRTAPLGGALLPKWDLDALDARIAALAKLEVEGRARLEVTRMGAIERTSLYALHLPALGPREPRLRMLVTGGVHGAEAAGPSAAMAFVDHLLAHPELREAVEVTVVPLVNPIGFREHQRANGDGVDLNRRFSDADDAPREVRLFREAIRGAEFDLSIDLHASASVGRRGFFAIHDGTGAELLGPTVADFARRFPVVSESTALYAMDAPGIFQSKNAGTLKSYLKSRGTPWAYTVEAPAKSEYGHQVRGLTDFLASALASALTLRAGLARGLTPGSRPPCPAGARERG